MQTFRRRVLDVSHIEIEAPAVTKKASVTRWLFVVAVMQIDRAGLGVSEKMVFYLRGPELGINMRLFFTQQTAVFGFDPNDPVHCNQLTHRIAIWLNENPPYLNPLPKTGRGKY